MDGAGPPGIPDVHRHPLPPHLPLRRREVGSTVASCGCRLEPRPTFTIQETEISVSPQHRDGKGSGSWGGGQEQQMCRLRRQHLRPCEYDATANGRCNRGGKQNFLCGSKLLAEIRAALKKTPPPPPARFDAAVVLICTEAAVRSACGGERGFKEALVSVLLIYRLEPTTK